MMRRLHIVSERVNSNRGLIGALGMFLFILAPALAFVHPFGNARLAHSDDGLMNTARIDSPVLAVMQRACQNCHSEKTEWPWYSHAAPMSWLIERDVQGGRSQWNMSTWEQYSIADREQILSKIGPMVRNRKMPLPQYLFLHPEAKLSDADVDLLYQWSRKERKRMRSEAGEAVSETQK